MNKEDKQLLAVHLDKYIKDKHTLDECCGFSDGFKLALELAKNNEVLDLVSGCFYWVKQTETCEYEPAIAECRYEKGVLYFCFTCGGAIRCDRVVDYKRLNNR